MADLEGLEPIGDGGEGWRLRTSDGEAEARAVILATGARLKSLGVDGEERLQGRGVSHCASCDAPLMRDRTVGVVGGGDSALQEALTLAEAVGEVIVLHRGDELTAQAAYREPALEHPKISVRYGVEVEEILGEDAIERRAPARRRLRRHRGARARRPLHLRRPGAQQRVRRRCDRARRRRAHPDRRVAADRRSPACSRRASCAAARWCRRPSPPARARRPPRPRTATSAASTNRQRRPRPPEANAGGSHA